MEAKVNGVTCDLLDSRGRLIVTPNALSVQGQKNIPADLREGETLEDFLKRHVENLTDSGWVVAIDGYEIKREDWAITLPVPGQLIACRAAVGKSVLSLVAMAALTYFTFGFGAATAGMYGAGAVAASALGAVGAIGVYIAGSVLINKVLGPKVPKAGVVDQGATQYALRDQRNRARPHEPIPIVWGVVRTAPDLASQSYNTYEGADQYLQMILLAGLNVQNMENLTVGDTPLSSYNSVEYFYDHVPGQPQSGIPIFTNADSIPGGDLTNGGPGTVRTTSVDTIAFQVDLEGQLYDINNKGGTSPNGVTVTIESAPFGTEVWTKNVEERLANSRTDLVRRTYTVSVPKGQYNVRVTMGVPDWNDGGSSDMCKFVMQTLRSVQEDKADYSRFGRLGLRIKATGQLTSLDNLYATMTAKPMPVWTTGGWQTATTRENGLSNPGAIMLQALRGIRDENNGELLWGAGYPDEMIDIESFKSFMLYCAAKNYTYDKWVTASVSVGDFLSEVALAGLAEYSYVDGSRPSVVFISDNQPISGIVGMANMSKGSFSVDYTLSNAADGIEVKYADRERNWEVQTLRVMMPGSTTMLNPAQITVEGVTTEAQASVLARYHLAQSIYQYKTITYGSDLESLDYRRLSVVSLSHDMTQWGVSGRLLAISKGTDGVVTLQVDADVPVLPEPYIGLRIHGERDYRVFRVKPVTAETDTLELAVPWPEDTLLPGQDGGLVYDTLWCYDFKPTPGYRVRVIDMAAEEEMEGATVTCVPEGPEFWQYVELGVYTPPPTQAVRPREVAIIKDLNVTEQTNIQGDTEWYELTVSWSIAGDYDHSQVWAGVDGSELRMVDGNAVGASSTFRVDRKGRWLIRVTPINTRGVAGVTETVVYITTGIDLPPPNPGVFTVTQVEGSLRRFGWSYTRRPAALAGVQIRYLAGSGLNLSSADWGRMLPLGDADDVYSAAVITTKPDAGSYTFGLRAINTSGVLAEGMVTAVADLGTVFDDIIQPDLTPPPTPTGFQVSAGLSTALLETDATAYNEGHGHDKTIFYRAEVTTAKPNPQFADAKVILEIPGNIGSVAVELGKTYRWWAKWQSMDGVKSTNPTAPITITVGKIGNADLGPLIIEAENLADNSVSGSKLAQGAVDSTKFANGIEPVTNSSSPTLPTVKSTNTITWKGKLYRWDGTKYTAEVPTADLVGQINTSQIAAGAIDDTKFANGIEPVTIVAGSTLPVVKSTSTIVFQGKLYRWNGTKYTSEVPAGDLTGQVNSSQIAVGAIDSTKFANGIEPVTIVAGATLPTVKSTSTVVFQGKLYRWNGTKYTSEVPAGDLTGQISAGQIAAGAIDNTKFANGIEPITIVSGSVLPTTKSTSAIVFQGKLYRWDGAKYTNEVAVGDMVGQITATQIADNAISTPKLAANAVSADKIAANAVTADKVAANAITAGKIAVGAVNADQIAAGAVTAKQLVVADFANLIPDPDFTSLGDASGSGSWYVVGTTVGTVERYTGAEGAGILMTKFAGQTLEFSVRTENWRNNNPVNFVPVKEGDKLRVQCVVTRKAGASGGNVGLYADSITAAGAVSGTPISGTAGTTPLDTPQTVNGEYTVPADVVGMRFRVYYGNSASSSAGSVAVTNLSVRRMNTAELIVDGAITADKVAANAITTAKIAANAVTANEIAANAVTAAKIAAGAVTADQIAANAITAKQMTIADYSNIVIDPFMQEPSCWGTLPETYAPVLPTDPGVPPNMPGLAGRKVARVSGVYMTGRNVPVTPGEVYYISCMVASNKLTGTAIALQVATYSGGTVGGNNGTYREILAGATINTVAATDTWQLLEGFITVPDVPASPRTFIKFRVAVGSGAAVDATSFYYLTNFTMRRAASANLIVDGAITADKIAVNAVTAGKIAANAVTADNVAANAITTAKIAAGAVRADQIAANSIATSKLLISNTSNLISNPTYIDRQDWPSEPAGGAGTGFEAVTTAYPGMPTGGLAQRLNQREAGTSNMTVYSVACQPVAVQAGEAYIATAWVFLTARPVRTAATIATQVYASALPNSAATLGNLRAGSISSADIPLGTWVEIPVGPPITVPDGAAYLVVRPTWYFTPDDTPNAARLYVGAMRLHKAADSSLIVDGAITADKIAANAITATKIAAGAVTAGKIAANAVTANEIAANAITTAKIAAGAVTADQIAANAITVKQLTVMDFSNIVLDPYMQDTSSWAEFNAGFEAITPSTAGVPAGMPGPAGRRASRGSTTANISLNTRNFQVNPGDTYYVSAWVATNKLSGRNFVMQLRTFANNGSEGGANGTHIAYIGAVTTGLTAMNTWQKVEGFATIPESATNPATFARLRVVVEGGTADATSDFFVTNLMVRRAASANLVVDGAITANKIAVNAIAVGTAAIQNGAIVNAMIANATIDNAKIANLSAAKITGGSMQVGSYISSSNYVGGSQGWGINSNGQAEFFQVTVRGSIYSNLGVIGGINLNANGLNGGAFVGYQWPTSGSGFHLGPNGLLLGNANTGRYVELGANGSVSMPGFTVNNGNAVFSGALQAASGSFTGNLSGASGTFSGTLTAQNIVTTENLKSNSVTVPLYAQSGIGVQYPETALNTPVFGASMQCVINFGCEFRITAYTNPVALDVYIDGVLYRRVQLYTPGVESGPASYSSGSYVVSIPGNGAGRRISVSLYNISNNAYGSVYIQATIFKK